VRRVVVHPEADQDLDEHFAYISADRPGAGIRFLSSARAAMDRLAEFPGIGRAREFKNPALAGIRSWAIPGFERYLMFYRQIADGVEVVRVVHGARDVPTILGEQGAEKLDH
jgi:toxin ParE1/3/4